MTHRRTWLVLILLIAAFLRLAALDEIPPGLTHDEADHGLDAWGVVNGIRPLYFTVGYGREPLFDYSTAGLMAFMGPTFMAGRLTAAFFSLILVAGTYAWIRRALNGKTALLAAAGVAVSFWAVMTGRQALRSVTFPALFSLSVYFFWYALHWSRSPYRKSSPAVPNDQPRLPPMAAFIIGGALLGITFYAYLPARLMWVIFPGIMVFLLLFDRHRFRESWRGAILMLLVAGLIATPLLIYLGSNPEAEIRLDQLSGPLEAAARGNFRTLLDNTLSSLSLLTFRGDELARYNIPGRAFLSPPMALLFAAGLIASIWWVIEGIRDRSKIAKASAAAFALGWLLVGLSPALITGPDASTTRIIGLLPVIYLFPAIPLASLLDSQYIPQKLSKSLVTALFAVVLVLTIRDYFVSWANDPEVRVQYESTLVEAMTYLNESDHGPAAVSNTTPDRFHSPSVALLYLDDEDAAIRWFNGQHSLVAPLGEESVTIFSGFAPLDPKLEQYFLGELAATLPMRSTDIDRPITVYRTDGAAMLALWQKLYQDEILLPEGADLPLMFGTSLELLGYDLQQPEANAGSDVLLATFWRVRESLENAVLFSQVIGSDGLPVAQDDRLDVPGFYWQSGDVFVQLHQIHVPEATAPGEYPLIAGLYTRPSLERQPVVIDGKVAGDHVQLASLIVLE